MEKQDTKQVRILNEIIELIKEEFPESESVQEKLLSKIVRIEL